MTTRYLYPGSFHPPTYGHLGILQKACEILPFVTVVCSRNPIKTYRFDQNKRRSLWHSYDLPENCEITTFDQLMQRGRLNGKSVIVRGLRSPEQLTEEIEVVRINSTRFGIESYLHILGDEKRRTTSSSTAWRLAAAADLSGLSHMLAPLCVSAVIEQTFDFKNLFLVVGKPASGKSTFLRALAKQDPSFVHIETDLIAEKIKPVLRDHFPGQDLVELATNRPEELVAVTGQLWLAELGQLLLQTQAGSTVFVEAGYGLLPPYDLYRFVGGKVLYLGCDSVENVSRITKRGTPEHLPLAENIFGLAESQRLAREKHLLLWTVVTSGNLASLRLWRENSE